MADTKVTGLTQNSTPAAGDYLYTVDDPGGTPLGQYVTVGDVLKKVLTAEIFLPASSMWPSTTGGCADAAKTEYTTNDQDLYELAFDASTDEYAQATIWMPDDWDGSTITFKPVWTAASSTGDVIWGLQGRSYANDDAIDQAWGTAQTSTDTLLATGDIHYGPESSAITLAGTPAAGELIQLRVYRDADAGGDTLAADAKLLGIKIYYGRA